MGHTFKEVSPTIYKQNKTDQNEESKQEHWNLFILINISINVIHWLKKKKKESDIMYWLHSFENKLEKNTC